MIVQVPNSRETEGLKKGDTVCVTIKDNLIGFGTVLQTGGYGVKVELDAEAEKNVLNILK